MKLSIKSVTRGGIIAALYVVLTFVSAMFGLSSGVFQIRLSESLCILAAFMPEAIGGLFVGCLIANLLTGAAIIDVIAGSLATLLAAIGTYLLRKNRYLAVVPPIVVNAVIVSAVIHYAYMPSFALWKICLFVALGETVSAGILGQFVYEMIKRNMRFKNM
ncbi:MAG: QueT transporter family protein [Lachnospiraceae bacterium]|nr:QueT transporter family protein [Candidatus Colinaster equi]